MSQPSPFHLQAELDSRYAQTTQQLAFNATTMDEYKVWKQRLRRQLVEILGIAGRAIPAAVHVEQIHRNDKGAYVEEKYALDVGQETPAPLYVLIPKTPPPYKAVLAFHGHGPGIQPTLGNSPGSHGDERGFARQLVEAGYLVAAVEQRGFGERKSNQIHPEFGNSCRQLSFDYLLQGRTMVGERCWDGMVTLSYLLSREDVIPGAVGCMGFSGGGTTCLWMSALDDRIQVAVPASYFCSFKDSILAISHCECNYVPHILDYAEIGDFAALIAPRPFRAVTGEHDPIFGINGVRQQFETVKKAYALLGVPEHCSLVAHPGEHEYRHELVDEWLARWL